MRAQGAVQEQVGQAALVVDFKHLMQGGPAQVGIHHQHRRPGLGQNYRQVGGNGGFPNVGGGPGNQDGPYRFLQSGKLDIGPQGTVGFRHRGTGIGKGNQGIGGVTFFSLLLHLFFLHIRDNPQDWQAQVLLDILRSLNGIVQVLQ